MSVYSKQNRVLEITMVADVSANTFDVSAIKIRRDGTAGTPFSVAFTQTAAGNPNDLLLGEALPQDVSIIRLTGTIQA